MTGRHLIALAALLCAACGGRGGAVPRPAAATGLEATYREAARLRGAALAAMDGEDWAAAIELWAALEVILPDNLIAPLDLAVAHLQAGEVDAAERAAERARQLAPDNPLLLYALARIYDALDDRDAWERTLDHYASVHPGDPRPYFLRLRAFEESGDGDAAYRAAEAAVDRDPENLVLLADRLATAAQAGLGAATEDALYAVEDRLGGFDDVLESQAEDLRAALLAGETRGLYPRALGIRNILRPSELYRQNLIPLAGSLGPRGAFVQLDFEPPLPKSIQGGQDIAIAFVEVPAAAAPAPPAELRSPLRVDATADRDTLLADSTAGLVRLTETDGRWRSDPVSELPADRVWSTLDFDQDGRSDLLVERDGTLALHGTATDSPAIVTPGAPILGVYPVDCDLEGDVDLVVATATGPRYLRNNGDGTWLEEPAMIAAIAGETVTALASADFDDDGDLDLAVATGDGLRLLSNPRSGALEDVSASWGLELPRLGGARLEVEDFDGDGRFDLLAWSDRAAVHLANRGDRFAAVPLPGSSDQGWRGAAVADFDNDGDRDLVAAPADGPALLLRNRRHGFEVETLAVGAAAVAGLVAGDFDGDGDVDLVAAAAAGTRYWRNDGGALNNWLRLRLRGKTEGNSKNNSQGLFVRIESRVGGAYQAVLGNGGVNHLGLGAARQVDALRVVWTNGLGQTWAALAARQSLEEEQVLKGSCPFLYAWNGERFEFVTDLMWGSPLGMILADGSPAPHQSAQDFVLISGEQLRPAGGELFLQTTEELWEAVYLDRQQLLAIDHPAGVDLVVDEKFTPPPHPREPVLHWVERWLAPSGARGPAGSDALARVAARDGRHVGELPLTRHQGVTREHSIELDFAGVPAGQRLRLVLWGWVFPTDTSINVALSQSERPAPGPPRLELREPDGGWRTLLPAIGFPAGKRKAVVTELTGLLPAGPVTLRLTSQLEIYWDAAALAVGDSAVAPRITALEPARADLHYRGFSRLVRESASAPHLFDYADVSTLPRFRDLRGLYTRFGRVDELLAAADDLYVVMNAGDELTVRFPAADLPALPPGWRRDYVLHTDGWVKDGDLNTTASQTVEPLPYHAMTAYPDPDHRFPDDPRHRRWRREYQTRRVDDTPFRELLRNPVRP